MTNSVPRRWQRWIERHVAIQPGEWLSFYWSFLWFFCVLSAYYVVRPVRETIGTHVGSIEALFPPTFGVMLLASPFYNWLVDHTDRRRLVPIIYRFFSLCLIVFSLGIYWQGTPTAALGITFFIWVSVFNLFAVALFWSVLADVFSSEQGKRLFAPISAGGSLGGLLASAFVSGWSQSIGEPVLLLVPVVLLELSLACARQLERHLPPRSQDDDAPAANGAETMQPGVWTGFLSIWQSPYLLGICGFLLLGKWCATTVYLEQMSFVKSQVESGARTGLFALENLIVQVLTLVFQVYLTQRLIRWFDLRFTLAFLPICLIGGFLATGIAPTLIGWFSVQILQRVLSYGVVVPAREVLFTVVSREDKYKTKGFIDTALFRGGDTLASSLHWAIRSVVSGAPSALWMIPVSVAWGVLGWQMGAAQKRKEAATSPLPLPRAGE